MNCYSPFACLSLGCLFAAGTLAPHALRAEDATTTRRPTSAPAVDFARDVYPLLQRSCLECHGPVKQEGGLRLDRRSDALDSGTISAGAPDDSELLRRIALPRGHSEVMPAIGEPLTPRQVTLVRRWIAEGATWPEAFEQPPHWSYVAPVRPPLPEVADEAWVRSPIDRFVLQRLAEEGLHPSPQATPEKRVRRLFLDLIGLPPTPAEVNAFAAQPTPQRWEQLVDELLERPQFGERWARPWLDLARYADSHGFQRDDLRDNWAYRDWVISALNQDMPFDQFTIEQLAGDLLPGATESQKIATGFHRCAPTNVEAGSLPEATRTAQVLDRVNTTGAIWLGSTLECCQCHDHKYDPFTLEEYYQLFAFFNHTALEADLTKPDTPSSIQFQGPTLSLADAPRDVARAGYQAELAQLEQLQTSVEQDAESAQRTKRIAELKQQIADLAPDTTLVMVELTQPRTTTVFLRGDYKSPGNPVTPGTPAALHPLSENQSSGSPNRLTLARWLVSTDNPLVARATVNRWWAELFGQGIVTTVEDLGVKGEPPSHPELLDWLAVEFMHSGWSMKHVLKTIVLSATYQQSSRITPQLWARDDHNQLLARGPRLRMDAEMIRDNALSIAGLLELKQFGPPIRPPQPDGIWTKVGGQAYDYVVSPGSEQYRRGVYVVLKRGAPYPSFVNFDASARLACTVRRSRTNTPLQALTLLNDPVYVTAARALAERVLVERSSATLETQLDYAFQLCVARTPHESERQILIELFQSQAAAKRERAPSPSNVPAERQAWISVATTLLNLHETITKD